MEVIYINSGKGHGAGDKPWLYDSKSQTLYVEEGSSHHSEFLPQVHQRNPELDVYGYHGTTAVGEVAMDTYSNQVYATQYYGPALPQDAIDFLDSIKHAWFAYRRRHPRKIAPWQVSTQKLLAPEKPLWRKMIPFASTKIGMAEWVEDFTYRGPRHPIYPFVFWKGQVYIQEGVKATAASERELVARIAERDGVHPSAIYDTGNVGQIQPDTGEFKILAGWSANWPTIKKKLEPIMNMAQREPPDAMKSIRDSYDVARMQRATEEATKAFSDFGSKWTDIIDGGNPLYPLDNKPPETIDAVDVSWSEIPEHGKEVEIAGIPYIWDARSQRLIEKGLYQR